MYTYIYIYIYIYVHARALGRKAKAGVASQVRAAPRWHYTILDYTNMYYSIV